LSTLFLFTAPTLTYVLHRAVRTLVDMLLCARQDHNLFGTLCSVECTRSKTYL
jgi:hypothetical protein